ncbi:MAG: sulfatase [Armatimonadetes bacterium]|nr:sulfatase [Armatimonadota bacterium]
MACEQEARPGYHLGLWWTVTFLFLALDFGKRTNWHFLGLSPEELAVNVVVVAVVGMGISAIAGVLSLALARVAGPRPVHALFWFAIYTVNVWSLKIGFSQAFSSLGPGARQVLAVGSLALGVALAAVLARKYPWLPVYTRHGSRVFLIGGALSLGGLLLTGAAAWSRPAPAARPGAAPNVILVTVDALAAGNMSLYGYARETTPNLDALGRESIVFERFFANSNSTLTALPCFLGYYPTAGPAAGPNLPQVLAERGYPNRCFIGHWPADFFGMPGFADSVAVRSFMARPLYRLLRRVYTTDQLVWLAALGSEEWEYYNPYVPRAYDDVHWTYEHFPPDVALETALAYLEEHPTGTFLWVHLWQPHYPYLPDAPFDRTFGEVVLRPEPLINQPYPPQDEEYVSQVLRTRYDQNVRSLDEHLGRFLGELRRRGFYDRSVLAVSSDHGQSFERGYVGHHSWILTEPVTRVPLILHLPSQAQMAVRVKTFGQQLDLAPTLLSMFGIPVPPAMLGESLLPYLHDPEQSSRRFKVSLSYTAVHKDQGQIAVYQYPYKLVYLAEDRDSYLLFDLSQDPEARRDISAQQPEVARRILQSVRFRTGGASSPKP